MAKPKVVRVPIATRIPPSLARRVDATAQRERRFVQAVVELALEQYVTKSEREAQAKQ